MWWRASPQKGFWAVRASFRCFSLLSRWFGPFTWQLCGNRWIWTCWSCHRDAFIVPLYLLSLMPLMSGVQLDVAINHKLKGRAGAWRLVHEWRQRFGPERCRLWAALQKSGATYINESLGDSGFLICSTCRWRKGTRGHKLGWNRLWWPIPASH